MKGMMPGIITQDTVRPMVIIRISTDNLLPDSVFMRLDEKPAFMRAADSGSLSKKEYRISSELPVIEDTTSVCSRNSIADITFSRSPNFVTDIFHNPRIRPLPFKFADKTSDIHAEKGTFILTGLKDGIILPEKSVQNDWIITVILLISFLYLVVRSTTRRMLPEFSRFILLRGIGEYSPRDTGVIFTWQSTLLNLVSFIILGLFALCAALYYGFMPQGFSPAGFTLLSSGAVAFGITSRHLICMITGNLSGEYEAFNQYLISIYQYYRLSSVIIFVLVVLIAYTTILPPPFYFITGLLVLGFFYFHRVIRLSVIFVKKGLSILYLILYLCALEILPVLILSKYLTDLF